MTASLNVQRYESSEIDGPFCENLFTKLFTVEISGLVVLYTLTWVDIGRFVGILVNETVLLRYSNGESIGVIVCSTVVLFFLFNQKTTPRISPMATPMIMYNPYFFQNIGSFILLFINIILMRSPLYMSVVVFHKRH